MPTRQWSAVWSGWIGFAALLMIIMGVVNILEGIMTIAYPDRTVVLANELYVVNLRGWGILILAFGAVLTCAGIGLISARTWARVVAIVVVALHAVVQIGWLGAYPLWSLLVLGLDVVVLFALVARWGAASTSRADYGPAMATDPRDQQATWAQHPRTVA